MPGLETFRSLSWSDRKLDRTADGDLREPVRVGDGSDLLSRQILSFIRGKISELVKPESRYSPISWYGKDFYVDRLPLSSGQQNRSL